MALVVCLFVDFSGGLQFPSTPGAAVVGSHLVWPYVAFWCSALVVSLWGYPARKT